MHYCFIVNDIRYVVSATSFYRAVAKVNAVFDLRLNVDKHDFKFYVKNKGRSDVVIFLSYLLPTEPTHDWDLPDNIKDTVYIRKGPHVTAKESVIVAQTQYELTEFQLQLLFVLKHNGPQTYKSLIELLKKPRSTIYDNLLELILYQMVRKSKKKLGTGLGGSTTFFECIVTDVTILKKIEGAQLTYE
jgi:predicted transcriptional regulator